MPKRSDDAGTQSDPKEGLVRFTALMTPDDRLRLKLFCLRIKQDMELVGGKWIMDRLAIEERKLDKR